MERGGVMKDFNSSVSENTTMDSQLLQLLKTLHDETLSNWTGSFDDFDYLNIPLVKVWYWSVYRRFFNKTKRVQ